MKVDITLTVGGNDVTINYEEGKKLFLELKALYEPSSKENRPYAVFGADSVDSDSSSKNLINEDNEISKDTQESIDKIKNLSNVTLVSEKDLNEDVEEDDTINTEIIDAETAERMKKMQEIIDKMNKPN